MGEILRSLDRFSGVFELEDTSLLGVCDTVLIELTHFKIFLNYIIGFALIFDYYQTFKSKTPKHLQKISKNTICFVV